MTLVPVQSRTITVYPDQFETNFHFPVKSPEASLDYYLDLTYIMGESNNDVIASYTIDATPFQETLGDNGTGDTLTDDGTGDTLVFGNPPASFQQPSGNGNIITFNANGGTAGTATVYRITVTTEYGRIFSYDLFLPCAELSSQNCFSAPVVTVGMTGPQGATGPQGPAGPSPIRLVQGQFDTPTLSDEAGLIGYQSNLPITVTANDLGALVTYSCVQLGQASVTVIPGLGVTMFFEGEVVNRVGTAWTGATLSVMGSGEDMIFVNGDISVGF